MTLSPGRCVLVAAAMAGIAALPAHAETITLTAELGANEIPPNDATAAGKATMTLDTETKQLSWTVTHEGISGPLIGAHIHGPAPSSDNAGILIPLDAGTNPIEGSVEVTDEQATYLLDGETYVNLHTEKHPGGELRGQLTR